MLNLSKLRLPFREDKLFSLLLFTVLVVPLAFTIYGYENFESIKFGLFLLLTGTACFVLVKNYFGNSEEKKNIRLSKVEKIFIILVAFFWLFGLISAVLAPDKLHALVGFYYRFVNGLLFYTLWSLFLVFLILSGSEEKLKFLAKVLVFVSLLIAVIGIIQSMGVAFYSGLEPNGFLRAPSLLGNPNFSSMFLVTVLPLVLGFFYTAETFKRKIYFGLTGFFIVWCLVLLSSRGAWLALIGSLIFAVILLLFFKLKRKYVLTVAGALVVFLGLGAVFLQVTRPSSIAPTLYLTDTNVNSRLYVWDIARQAVLSKPWFGVGLSNFHSFYERHRDKHLAADGLIFDDPHNLFLHIASTGGVIFVLIFLSLLGLAVYVGLQNRESILKFSAIISLAAWVIAACFTPVPTACFLLLAVLLVLLLKGEEQSLEFSLASFLKYPTAILAVFFVLFGLSFLTAEHLSFFANRTYLSQDFSKSLSLQKIAMTLNPTNELYYINKTYAHIMNGGSEEEITQDVLEIKSLHSKEARTFVSTSNIYYTLFVKTGQVKFLDFAIEDLKTALSLDPFFADRYGKLGLYYYLKNDLEPARGLTELALSLNPNQFSGWLLLARIFQIQDRQEPALFALEKAYMLQPTLPEMRYVWYFAKQSKEIKSVPLDFFIQAPLLGESAN